MMSIEELQQDKAQMEASLTHWQGKLQEAQDIIQRAQKQAAQAQLQLAVHDGHLERINIWLKRLTEAAQNGELGVGK